jgi:hypothetical protein
LEGRNDASKERLSISRGRRGYERKSLAECYRKTLEDKNGNSRDRKEASIDEKASQGMVKVFLTTEKARSFY